MFGCFGPQPKNRAAFVLPALQSIARQPANGPIAQHRFHRAPVPRARLPVELPCPSNSIDGLLTIILQGLGPKAKRPRDFGVSGPPSEGLATSWASSRGCNQVDDDLC